MGKKKRAGLVGAVLASLLLLHDGQRAIADDSSATQYDGVDDYAIATNVTGGNLGDSAGTFYLWMKRNGTAGLVNDPDYNGLYNLLMLKTGSGANTPKVGLGLTADGRSRIYRFRFHPHESMPGTTVVADNQWHFLALTSDGAGTLKLYVDGNLEVTWSHETWNMAGAQFLVLASYYDVSAYLSFTQTLIDQVAIWSGERTQAQIQADMSTSLNGNEAGLVAYWPMDEGMGDTTSDATGDGQTLSLVNGVMWAQPPQPSCEDNLAQCGTDLSQCGVDLSTCTDSLGATNAALSQCNTTLAITQAALAAAIADADQDGLPDLYDHCPGTGVEAEIDDGGCSLVQFCHAIDATTPRGARSCKKSDWRNDEPVMTPQEADCTVDKGGPGSADDRCVPHA